MERRATRSVVGVVTAAAAFHFVPYAAAHGALRRRWFPALAGLGAGDTVALTFDDGPDPASTPAFLAELDRLGWRATFFVLGENVRAHPALARELVAAGHEVAVHGDRHRSHVGRPPWSGVADVRRARDTVADVTATTPRWFRPPHGALSAGTLWAARSAGLTPVLWTAWGRDWRAAATPESVLATLRPDLGRGATVLLHDSDCTSAPGAWRAALGALPLLADELAARRLGVGPLGPHLDARRAVAC
jgi:peptidoglycan/xylan/chitin deacetylase (PgdA/CDA1 family)